MDFIILVSSLDVSPLHTDLTILNFIELVNFSITNLLYLSPVFMDAKGSVFVCGSNSFGQLGLGDLAPRHTPAKIKFPDSNLKIIQIGAGSYHTVALDSNGVVYTCGAHAVLIY